MSIKETDNTREVIAALNRAIRRGWEAIGMTAERYAKAGTPVDTGRLKNSIGHKTRQNAVYIGTNVDYAPYVELGAQGREGEHMLQRAATEHADEYKKLMEESIKNA